MSKLNSERLRRRFREVWHQIPKTVTWEVHEALANLHTRVSHLEAQKSSETPGSETPPEQWQGVQAQVQDLKLKAQRAGSETPSSPDTEPGWAMKVTSRTSRKWSCPVSRGGSLTPSQQQDILAWLNSLWTVGDGLEVEIGVTLTSKAATPPSGSASPSTEAPTPAASGVAGEVESHRHKGYEEFWQEKRGDFPASAHHKAGFHGGYWQALKEQSSPSPSSGTAASAAGGGEEELWSLIKLAEPIVRMARLTGRLEPVACQWSVDFDKGFWKHYEAMEHRFPSSSPSTSAVGGESEG